MSTKLLDWAGWITEAGVHRSDEELEPGDPVDGEEFVMECLGQGLPIILEGSRYVGKTYLSNLFEKAGYTYFTVGKTIKERKAMMEATGSGRTGAADYDSMGLSIAQASLWALDTIAQLGLKKVIIDRTILSSFWFQDSVHPGHWELWKTLVPQLQATLVFLYPPSSVQHRGRCWDKGGNYEELIREKMAYHAMMKKVPQDINVVPISIQADDHL